MTDGLNNLLEVVRKNTANDLRYSNEILSIVDAFLEKALAKRLDEKDTELMAEKLVHIASQLTDQSSTASSLIAKVMGAMR